MENIKELQEVISSYKILYAEDDKDTAEAFIKYLSRLFGEVVYVENGKQGLELYKEDEFDLVITDIRMPEMGGIEMAQEIKKLNKEQNILIVSGYSNSETILSSIKIGIDGYLVKPINAIDMNNTLHKVCTKIRKYKENDEHKKTLESLVAQITQKNNELTQYVDILDHVAIVSKTDLRGKITQVNDFFCEVSEFSREEIIGQTHNIVRHEDMAKAVYDTMWNTIKNGGIWKGTLKNKTKSGKPYFVMTTIMPLFDEDNNIKEYIGIRFLTTKEQEERREFKKKVLVSYQEYRKDNFNAHKKIEHQIKEIEHLSTENIRQAQIIQNLTEQNQKLYVQKKFYEKENKYLRSLESSSASIKKMVTQYQHDQVTLEEQQHRIEELLDEVKEKQELEEHIKKQAEIIKELKQELEEA